MIRKRLQSQQVAHWFSPHWTLFNECSILSVEHGKVVEHRPDRVMKDSEKTIVVDFKFGKPKDEHHVQVRQYMQLLEGMRGQPKCKFRQRKRQSSTDRRLSVVCLSQQDSQGGILTPQTKT